MIKTAPLLGPLGRRCLDDALRQRDVARLPARASEIVVRRGRRVVRHTPLLVRTIIIGVKDPDHLDGVVSLPGVVEAVTYTAVDTENEGNIPAWSVASPASIPRRSSGSLTPWRTARSSSRSVEVGSQVVVMVGPFASFPAIVRSHSAERPLESRRQHLWPSVARRVRHCRRDARVISSPVRAYCRRRTPPSGVDVVPRRRRVRPLLCNGSARSKPLHQRCTIRNLLTEEWRPG